MTIFSLPPPANESELLARAQALAGSSLEQIAARLDRRVPQDLRRAKGWVGELLELALGATSGSQAVPDFPALGVEMKTLPLQADGRPKESTYVCTVPLTDSEACWETSWIRRKLNRVLWLPVEAQAGMPLSVRRVGMPLLWSPNSEEEAILRADWEELMDMVCLGELEMITAHYGIYLQIRPKAANGHALCEGIGEDGARIRTLPRGFYLRSSFTAALLGRYYAT
ncbi:DNA mismatch repair protein MutH [Nitrosococcus oceani ATCC 19707]|uniref:DNA mismatch repair protein MutH n=2 Tax=Nitrosococcus oceani TaxID=1229 RepID=Q3J7B9_NITOC|nr:DNA mismatch repair endonuclease MutH [Nitrosococcus oceani]ABA59277.1 DNA mismatch repair protein MutH [Nitrosococcus oceani ATCC 19707]EDZ65463.1 DNA mismatch repair endonuclease MutH [Nitrosococcus oceani AFC27]KFI18305.1 DNA mismatch repair protein [Nitrosococcus oceani C-27]